VPLTELPVSVELAVVAESMAVSVDDCVWLTLVSISVVLPAEVTVAVYVSDDEALLV
jgi:hypothetical protein